MEDDQESYETMLRSVFGSFSLSSVLLFCLFLLHPIWYRYVCFLSEFVIRDPGERSHLIFVALLFVAVFLTALLFVLNGVLHKFGCQLDKLLHLIPLVVVVVGVVVLGVGVDVPREQI